MSSNKKMKIAHDYDELEDQIILTLKDRPILVNGNIDQEEDVLQNDQVQEANEAKYNTELKSKLKSIADAASSHLQAKNEGISDILPHYNDYTYKPSTIDMEDGGAIKFKKGKKKRALGQDYDQSQTTTSKLNSEYSAKSRKNLDKKTSSKQLLNFLQQTAEDNEPTFKRKLQADDIINTSLDILRKKRYTQNQIKNIMKESQIVDEEQSILMKSIEQSRRREREKENKFDLLKAIQEQDEEADNQGKMVEIELNPIAYKSSQSARLTKNVQVRQALSGTASVVHMHLPSQRLRKPKEEDLPESFTQLTEKQLEKMRAEVKFLQDKELGTGLSGTLAYLRQNALLGQEEQVGRYNDKQMTYNDPNDRIKLEYRNASGKLMKPKQAYRYICAKFHGEGPGMKKVQMRKKRQLEEMRSKQRQNSGGQLLQLLQKHQMKSGDAHMVLNIGAKSTK